MSKFLLEPVAHAAAVDFIKSKPAIAREVFDRMLPEIKARTITITGIEDANVLQAIRNRLAALPAGGDWDTIKREITADLYPFMVDDSAPAKERDQQIRAASRRSELLLRTHGFQAYQATQWELIQRQKDAFPYLMYMSREDERVRDTHAALHGLIFPVESPFWLTHFGPWDWGCRCQAVPMGKTEVEDRIRAEAILPDEQRTVMTGARLKRLEKTGVLDLGPNKQVNVQSPREAGKPGAYSWSPGDLRLPLDDLRQRYDDTTWAIFETQAKATPIPELKVTVWEWLSGETVLPGTAPVTISTAAPAGTVDAMFQRLGLDKKLQWAEADVRALRLALRKTSSLAATTRIESIDGLLEEKGRLSRAWVKRHANEVIRMLPPDVAATLPKLKIKVVTDSEIGVSRGDYDHITQVLRLNRDALMSDYSDELAAETVWHEIMHWIHLHGPAAYSDAIAAHFLARTRGEHLARLTGYGTDVFGKLDRWYDIYAGRIYFGHASDDAAGRGLEVPTRYFQLLANPRHLANIVNGYSGLHPSDFMETFKIVLGVFVK